MKRTLLILCLATALPAATSELPNPRSAAAGGTRPILENNRGEPIPAPGR